jgi:hypothetical protein
MLILVYLNKKDVFLLQKFSGFECNLAAFVVEDGLNYSCLNEQMVTFTHTLNFLCSLHLG